MCALARRGDDAGRRSAFEETGLHNPHDVAATLSYTVIYEPVENGWTQARLDELPAVITAAPTAEEATEQIIDALAEYLLALGHPHEHEEPGGPGTRTLTVTIQAA